MNLASGWDYTNIKSADTYLKPYTFLPNDLQDYFLVQSNIRFLGNLHQSEIAFPSYSTFRDTILYAFKTIPQVAADAGSFFVFAHILAPHPPFVFTSSGDPISPDYRLTLADAPELFSSLDEYRVGYFSEQEFINQQTLTMIDAILERSNPDPIIILQSDHGPGMLGRYDLLESTCVYERYAILNAYYFPLHDYQGIAEDITPVNAFRLVFNNYFGTNIPLLPDAQYYSSNQELFKFIDVSAQADMICP